MPHLDIRIEFSEEEDDGYTYYDPIAVYMSDTDLPQSALEGLAEGAHQSDFWQVGVSNAIFSALDGTSKITDFRY